jgi:Fic family protein
MIRIERKKSNNKPYFYLSERILINKKHKKIQVFIGKTVPKKIVDFYGALQAKELKLLDTRIAGGEFVMEYLELFWLKKIEKSKVQWKYFNAQLGTLQRKILVRTFSIRFIYESNAIEGSKLAESEVASIVENKYLKKSMPPKEITEVQNSITCFELLSSGVFILNQKHLKNLHAVLVEGLDIPTGFKKQAIVVSNKETVPPKEVRNELTKLFNWYKSSAATLHPFERAIIFHNRFEHIHPFTDGNGRVGRLLLNWMLMEKGYGFILFKNSSKTAYLRALDQADEGRYRSLLKLSTNTYARTIKEFCI